MAFYRKLLAAASNIGLKRSSADPCLFYKWEGGRVVIMISWIDDNMIVGPSDLVTKLKADLMNVNLVMVLQRLTPRIPLLLIYTWSPTLMSIQACSTITLLTIRNLVQ